MAQARRGAVAAPAATARATRRQLIALLQWLDRSRRDLCAEFIELLIDWQTWAQQLGAELLGTARSLWKTFWQRDRAVSRVLRKAAAREWYQLLKVRRRASKKQLKDAYRKLAKRVHPDKTRDDRATHAFDVLRDAYEVLSDAETRKRYDKELAKADEQAAQKRRKQREVAKQVAMRVLRKALRVGRIVAAALWERAVENPRVAAGVLAVLALLLMPSS